MIPAKNTLTPLAKWIRERFVASTRGEGFPLASLRNELRAEGLDPDEPSLIAAVRRVGSVDLVNGRWMVRLVRLPSEAEVAARLQAARLSPRKEGAR